MVQHDLSTNIETGGILGGQQKSDDWFVTYVVIPEQIQTDVSCLPTEQGQQKLENYPQCSVWREKYPCTCGKET